LSPITLVLGGARSGKSRFAEDLVMAAGAGTYLATAQARDDEMAARIRAHRDRRGTAWRTVEEPVDLVGALARNCAPDRPVLVECLTLWLSNLMEADRDLDRETDALVAALPEFDGPVVFVSNEVGLGIVPDNAAARAFRDAAGHLNQSVAAAADRVVLVAAGLPLDLKDGA
jgi:adenosylcobinamide kinase/adenosylcobinamide-phosphate guanylyltransferase